MAGGEDVGPWEAENPISDADLLYLRVHRANRDREGNPTAHAFSPQPAGATGLSVNWERYADAARTRLQARDMVNQKTGAAKRPEDYGVVSLVVGEVRAVDALAVVHDPVHAPPRNRAHSEVREIFYPDDAEVRVQLGRIYRWCIRVEAAVQESV